MQVHEFNGWHFDALHMYIYMRVCVSEAKSNMLSYILILFRLVPQNSRRNRQLSRRDLPIHRLCRFEILQHQKDG